MAQVKIIHNSGGFKAGKGGANAPLWWRVMYFCMHSCMSPSNDLELLREFSSDFQLLIFHFLGAPEPPI